jgi:hypothetical protein
VPSPGAFFDSREAAAGQFAADACGRRHRAVKFDDSAEFFEPNPGNRVYPLERYQPN